MEVTSKFGTPAWSISVSEPEKLRPSEEVLRTTFTIQGPLPEEFGGAATGVPTVLATFKSDTVGFFFDRRTSLPIVKLRDALFFCDRSELKLVSWVAFEGVVKTTITNAAIRAVFVFMNTT